MDNFIYDTPTKVYFGKGEEQNVGKIIAGYGAKKVLIHYGGKSAKESGLIDSVKSALAAQNIAFVELGGVVPNPELSLVRMGIELCKNEGVDFVLAVGGGSVLDSAKDIANGLANPEYDVWDFSLGKVSPVRTTKKGAILTLAAAGSEMSNSCVISNSATKEKRGYNSPFNRMDFAIENPELSYSVSPYQTACGAVDIAMHTIERYFCPGSDTYLTDSIAEAVIKSSMKAGLDCLADPKNYEARANMMWASSLAHNGLTQCGRSFQLTVHQLEHEVSAMYPEVAHGAGLAALWGSWARYVYKDCLPRFKQFAINVMNLEDTGSDEDIALRGIEAMEEFYRSINMPTNLRELGVEPTEEELALMAHKCAVGVGGEMGSAKVLNEEDMLAIYRASM
jgi:alcohol dehydrogenase YqhD (iron-dependent ADH family)